MRETPKPTLVERLILANQYAILEFLTRAFPDLAARDNVIYHDADSYVWMQNVIADGYDVLMSDIFQPIQDISLTYQEQRDILDILDMYSDLQWSYDELKDKKDIEERDVKFPGWDGNSPKGELSFARLFCFRGETDWSDKAKRKPDRFDSVRPSPAYNGHGDWMDNYYRMLQVYRPLKERLLHDTWRPFNYDEIRSIIDEFPHPDSPRGQEIRKLRNRGGC
jgi:uncharacterized protein YfbU (UPF0304 family)